MSSSEYQERKFCKVFCCFLLNSLFDYLDLRAEESQNKQVCLCHKSTI